MKVSELLPFKISAGWFAALLLTYLSCGGAHASLYQIHFARGFFFDFHPLNNANQAVGGSLNSEGSMQATIWDGTSVYQLNGPGGPDYAGYAFAINNLGQIVGHAYAPESLWRPTIWSGGAPSFIGQTTVRVGSGSAINDRGDIVGWASIAGSPILARLWRGSEVFELRAAGGVYSMPSSINNAGTIVGWSETSNNGYCSTVWIDLIPSCLPIEGGATDINDLGEIIGGTNHATLWNNGELRMLGTLGGHSSRALSINNAGKIVGESQLLDGRYSATLWDGIDTIDLNNLLNQELLTNGWRLVSADAINDIGSILGRARNELTGEYASYMLIMNVTEPHTSYLIILGLLIASLLARGGPNLLRPTVRSSSASRYCLR